MTSHQERRIGSLHVGPLGLGCMGMSTAYHRADPDEATAAIHRALDLGANLIDTAEMYGNGANEKLVGRALRGRRDDAVLATKFGIRTWPVLGLPRALDGHPRTVRRSLEGSLRRLAVDHVDLYYLHRVDPRVPVEETIGAMADLVTEGKVRELGVSEANAEQLRRAHTTHPLAALQSEWSLFSRDIETDVVPTARDLGIAIVAYCPLGRGMLTGSASATTRLGLLDYRRMLPRWRGKNLAHNLTQVTVVQEAAARLGATPGQVALAWLLARGEDVIPIPGTTRPSRVEENLAALDLDLPPEVITRLDTLRAAGARYGGHTGSAGPSESA